jgi:hypothetical protein
MTMRRLLGGLALCAVFGLLAGPVAGQDKDKDKAKDNPFEAYEKAAEPGPQHKLLEPTVGKWSFSGKFWLEPGKDPMETSGTATRKWILGGRFVQEEIEAKGFGGKPFHGLGLTGYDNLQQKYTTVWLDSMSTAAMLSFGTVDKTGKVFTYTKENYDPVMKKKVKSRDVVRILGDDKHVLEMFMEGPDGKEFKGMELTFTRQADKKP